MNLKRGYLVLVLSIILVILISGCIQQENVKSERASESTNKSKVEIQKPLPSTANKGLGTLCSGEKECVSFCLNNWGRCEGYCKGNHQNELCRVIFPSEGSPDESNIVINSVKCKGTKTKFDYAPVNLDKTLRMLPLGLMTGDHVTPVDHHYFQNFANGEFDIEVYSPGDGYITDIQPMSGAEEGKDYRIIIKHTCTISSTYIYVSNFPEKIKKYAPEKNRYVSVSIPVKAGELIGYYKNNLDYNLVDEEVVLSGFVVPEHYSEPWKIHIPNTYDYFNEPIKSKLIAKSVRTAEPISGKIDYDIDGKLVGNWFLEGTNGYRGTEQKRYWLGHLSIVYDYLDPERIVFSIGNYGGENSKQFGIKGNSPNPANIGIENGLVKYELVQYDYITPDGNSWDRKSLVKGLKTKNYEVVQGVALVQLTENRKIKFEVFPGETASQVNGFTSNAKYYTR